MNEAENFTSVLKPNQVKLNQTESCKSNVDSDVVSKEKTFDFDSDKSGKNFVKPNDTEISMKFDKKLILNADVVSKQNLDDHVNMKSNPVFRKDLNSTNVDDSMNMPSTVDKNVHCKGDLQNVYFSNSKKANVCKISSAKYVGHRNHFFPSKANFQNPKEFKRRVIRIEVLDENDLELSCPSVILQPESLNAIDVLCPSKSGNVLILPDTISGDEDLHIVPGVHEIKNGKARILITNNKQFKMPIQANKIKAKYVHEGWMSKEKFKEQYAEEEKKMEQNAARRQAQVLGEQVHGLAQQGEQQGEQKDKVQDKEGHQEFVEEDGEGGPPTLDELIKQLRVEENQLLRKHPKVKQKLKELIIKYQDVFGGAKEVGKTDLVECELTLKPGSKPVSQKFRPINPALEADLKKQVDRWLELKVIQPSKSPWSSPLVPVKKKDGTIRWACDLRRLNACLVQDSYPLPRIQQLLDRAGGHKIYSSLDAVQAYFCVPMEEKSRQLTAFQTPWGLMEWLRMPFGLAVATQVYSRLIAAALNPLGTNNLGAYLDDVLIFTNTMTAHLDKLEAVLEQHRQAGIKIKAEKTELFKSEMHFLGHKLNAEGIHMVDSYVERILQWPRPKTIKELGSLVGMFAYYSQFIPNFSKLMAPLNAQKKKKKLDWTEECQRNFELVKQEFSKKPLRSVPDFTSNEKFILTTDWSGEAIGVVLSQVQGGKERMLACGGRKCSPGETRYASWKGELAALIYGLRKYSHILSFKPFTVVTDASALKHLTTLKQTKGIVGRWLEEVQSYQFEVHHKPGKDNVVADAISRSSHMPDPTPEEVAESEAYSVQAIQPDKLLDVSRQLIREHQNEDNILRQVRGWVSRKSAPTREEMRFQPAEMHFWAKLCPHMSVANDGLLQVELPDKSMESMQKRIAVPQSLKKRIFEACHEHRSAGHFGVEATMARIKKNFVFFNLRTEVANRIKICHQCTAKEKQKSLKDGVHHSSQPGFPLENLFVDIVGPLNETPNGFKYILSVEDGYSRYTNVYPLRSKETQEVTRVLVDNFISQFGCPESITSDNGMEFASQIFKQMCREMQINKKYVPPYCPQSNKVERVHRVLNNFLKMSLEGQETDWHKSLPFFQLAYNSKVHTCTGVTPNLAFLGREASLPLDLMTRSPEDKKDVHQNVRNMLDRMEKMFHFIKRNGQAVIRRNTRLYTGRKNPYEEGDLVWFFTPRKISEKPAKITNSWLGPFRVTKKISEMLVEVTPAGYSGKKFVAHVSRIRKYHGELDAAKARRIPSGLVLDDQGDPEAEEVTSETKPSVEVGIPVYYGGGGEIPMVDLKDNKSQQRDETEAQDLVAGAAKNEVQDEVTAEEPPEEQEMEEAPEDIPLPEEDTSMPEAEENTPRTRQKRKMMQRGGLEKKRVHREATRRPRIKSDSEAGASKLLKRTTELAQSSSSSTSSSSDMATSSEDTDSSEMANLQVEETEMKIMRQKNSRMPVRKTETAAAFDLYAAEQTELQPGECQTISTGIHIEMPEDYYAKIESRSGLALKSVMAVGGLIDSDFRGEVKVILKNASKEKFAVKLHDRIAQIMFLDKPKVKLKEVERLNETRRGNNGFGSTGR